jgi:hypothetical protein
MFQLIRKSDAVQQGAPLWHPNFRDFERLPDTKVVRTTFFINAAAIAIAAGLLLMVGYREYHMREINRQISDTQADIDRNQKQSKDALEHSKKFADEEKKIREASAFVTRPVSPSEMILLLGQTLPREVQIESTDIRYSDSAPGQCVVRGLIAGTKDQASGAASSYVDTLRNSPKLAAIFQTINLNSLNTEARNGVLTFEIVLTFKSAGKGKKP